MHAEIIAIGDEITSGQLLDTNTQWLSRRLEEMGIRVLYHATVGDELEACAEVFRRAVDRADVVIATGGLGPTADDLTREAIAKATGLQLVLDQKALEHIRGMFARLTRRMPQQNQRQAMFPAGAQVIHNPNGTAPGIDLQISREPSGPCTVLALPGVPAEMKEMWHDSLCRRLGELGGGERVVRHRRIKCFGAGESQIEAMLPDLIRRGRTPRVGINASKTTIILRITAEGANEAECHAAMEPTIATIRECLGDLVFGEDDDELQDTVVRLLRRQNKTLATAEWGTVGLVAEALGSVAEAERVADAEGYYLGGLVAAGETALRSMLDVPSDLLVGHSPASGEVVAAMATGCREKFGADFSLAVGQMPQLDVPVDKRRPLHIALATPEGVTTKRFPCVGHPATLRIFCAKRAMNVLRLALFRE